MQQSIMCIASDLSEAEKLAQSLKNAGFTASDISLLLPDSFGAQELGYERHSKAAEGVAIGVTAGGCLGMIVGYLASIGVLPISGIDSLLTVGQAIPVLVGLAIGGTIGGSAGGLIGMSMPEYEVKKYARKIRCGSILMSVHTDCEKEIRTAEETLRNAGAADVKRTSEDTIRKKIRDHLSLGAS